MCLACEQQEYFFRLWCADFLARGEIPPGQTVIVTAGNGEMKFATQVAAAAS